MSVVCSTCGRHSFSVCACATEPDVYARFINASFQPGLSCARLEDFATEFRETTAGKAFASAGVLTPSFLERLFHVPCGDAALAVILDSLMWEQPLPAFRVRAALSRVEAMRAAFHKRTRLELPSMTIPELRYWPHKSITDVRWSVDRLARDGDNVVLLYDNAPVAYFCPTFPPRNVYLLTRGTHHFVSGFATFGPADVHPSAVQRELGLDIQPANYLVIRMEMGHGALAIVYEFEDEQFRVLVNKTTTLVAHRYF